MIKFQAFQAQSAIVALAYVKTLQTTTKIPSRDQILRATKGELVRLFQIIGEQKRKL